MRREGILSFTKTEGEDSLSPRITWLEDLF